MRADGVGVIDEAVVDAVTRLHLVLHSVHYITFTDDVVGQVNAGELTKGFRKHFAFINVSREAFSHGLNIHAAERLGSVGKPHQLFDLLFAAQG